MISVKGGQAVEQIKSGKFIAEADKTEDKG